MFLKRHDKKSIQLRSLKKASQLGEGATEEDVQKINSRLFSFKKGILLKIWDKVVFLWDCFNSPDVPAKLKVTIIGAFLYLILPADVIPDVIPGVGFVDDVSVLLFVFKEVTSFLGPKLLKKTQETLFESIYKKIDAKLSEIFKKTFFNSLVTFILNIISCLIFLLKPFGRKASFWVSNAIFFGLLIYTISNIAMYLKKYGKTSLAVLKNFLKEKNLEKAISSYIKKEYVYVSYIYAGIDFAKSVFPNMTEIPDLNQIVASFVTHYKKRVALFVFLVALYGVLVALVRFFALRS